MATVSFEDDADTWIAPRWIFCGFLEQILARTDDANLQRALAEALAFENLDLAGVDRVTARTLAGSILDAAELVAAGTIGAEREGTLVDADSQAQFRNKISALAQVVALRFGDDPTEGS